MLLRGKQFESQDMVMKKEKEKAACTRPNVQLQRRRREPFLSGTTDNSNTYICRFTYTIILPQHQFPLNHNSHSIQPIPSSSPLPFPSIVPPPLPPQSLHPPRPRSSLRTSNPRLTNRPSSSTTSRTARPRLCPQSCQTPNRA